MTIGDECQSGVTGLQRCPDFCTLTKLSICISRGSNRVASFPDVPKTLQRDSFSWKDAFVAPGDKLVEVEVGQGGQK